MTGQAPPAVELRGLTKRFGSIRANSGINLCVAAGTIHGIVGENGAGKSTAMNLLYGMHRPDSGEILIHGTACAFRSPAAAIARGIGMVHQHFMLAGPYSGLDNILLGAEPVRWGIIRRKQTLGRLELLARQYGLSVDLKLPVEQLPVGLQQRVEILKLLFRKADILILDEPTAVLTPQETGSLFENLRRLRAEGKTVLLVTHKLNEVISLTDEVTVFRAGQVIATMPTNQTTPQELANLMVGRNVSLAVAAPPMGPLREPGIEVSGLSIPEASGGRRKLSDVSLSVRRGELVGIAGVEGNGQSELLEAMLHPAERPTNSFGTVKFLGQDVTTFDARRIRDLGVAVIPEDRQQQGLLSERPVRENFILGLQRSRCFSRAGFLSEKRIAQAAARALETYDVRPRDLRALAGNLSGGNQQKLIIAREFERKPQVILAAHATRGLDVRASQFIHEQLLAARQAGAAILMISADLEEVLSLADRILVMYEGRVVAEFARGQASERELGLRIGGA